MNSRKKIKICHVITRMVIGGAQENTLFTVEGLSEKEDYDVTFITGPQTGPEGDLKYQIKKDRAYRMLIEPFLKRNINPFIDLIAFFRLVRHFKKEKYEIVHTHSSKAGILGRLAAKVCGTPLIVHTIHGLPFHPYQNRFLNVLYRWFEKIGAFCSDQIITVADAMSEQAIRAGVAKPDKFITIRSGMNLEPFLRRDYPQRLIRERYGIKPEDLVVGKIARLFHLKGHEYLIDAAEEVVKAFPNAKFFLVGDGILRDSLMEQIRKLRLEKNFVFAGLVKPEEIPELISIMDILVHVSLREGLAKVIPQALASGKPVVSFDLDGAREVVRNGVDGFLVKPCDFEGLAEAINKILGSKEMREQMGKEGKHMVDPYFRREYMVNAIDELYRRSLKCGR